MGKKVSTLSWTKYFYGSRLNRNETSPGEQLISFAYAYNDANQRTRRTDPDSSYWLYEYDKLGQLTSGKHYWDDATPVAGQQFEYSYDDIGNRSATMEGGDQSGAGLRRSSYSANLLNQFTNRTLSGAADIIGIAHPSAAVTVNGDNTYRKGEYFWKEFSISNTNSAMWTNPVVIASLTGTNQTNSGLLFLPKTPELSGYDADGNQTNDGRFSYSWDAENRLLQAESLSTSPTASKQKVFWQFDGGGHCVRQITYDGSSSSYVSTEDVKFINHGWQCVAELNATNDMKLRAYLWGLDVSGSMTGAGGVGGLLAIIPNNGIIFQSYDANGNVVAVASARGVKTANYEYDPFGRTLRSSGGACAENMHRFSTKRANISTDLVVYEHRAYNPVSGRWLNRDSIEERGGLNIYSFPSCDPINQIDYLGQAASLISTTVAVPPFTDDAPHVGKCGGFNWSVRWNITGGNFLPYVPVVIQHIAWSFAPNNCDRGKGAIDLNAVNPGGMYNNYWEAWQANPIQGTTTPPLDSWNMPDYPFGTDTYGTITINAFVAYYENPTFSYANISDTWLIGGDNPTGGGLYWTGRDPNLPPPESSLFHRRLVAEWDCCCGDRDTELTIVPR
jgi:RHS repeat-associated protein